MTGKIIALHIVISRFSDEAHFVTHSGLGYCSEGEDSVGIVVGF
jgi:hypothetical protein